MPSQELAAKQGERTPMSSNPFYSPESLATRDVIAYPYPAYHQLRPISPVQYPHLPAGIAPGIDEPLLAWGLLRHEDAYRALRDHDTFSSDKNLMVERGVYSRLVLLYDDPPRHTRFRRLVNQAFTTRRVEALEPWITSIVDGLLDEVGTGDTEIMLSFAIPLPMKVIARLLGIPTSEYRMFRRWSEAFLSVVGMANEERQQNIRDMTAYFGRMASERRTEGAEDLITALVEARVEGEALEEWEILGFCSLLLLAGNETTVNLLGNMLNALAERPALWKQLREDRGLVDAVIDETLRYESPIQRLLRRTTHEVELSGVRIPEGEVVTIFYGAANRDPDAFPDPDEFRLDRELRNHVAFGTGIHYCMGAPLARTEARIALNAFLDRYSSLRHSAAPAVRQSASFTVFGFQQLPITLSA
jgi:cytochrome P450